MNSFLIKETATDCQTQREPRPWRGFFPSKAKILKPRAQTLMEVKPSQPH